MTGPTPAPTDGRHNSPFPSLGLFTLRRVGGCSLEQEGRQAAVTQGHPQLSEPAGPTSDASRLLGED